MRATIILGFSEFGCVESDTCMKLARDEYETLNRPQYSRGASIMRLPLNLEQHLTEHRTFRKRVLRARRKGYHVRTIEPKDHHGEMLAINRSAPQRQGRPMSASYIDLPKSGPMTKYACRWHNVVMYGVLSEHDRLVGYATMYRCGDLLHVSQFLGHASFLDDGIMYLLVAEIMREHEDRPGVLFYNRHDSGTDGLRFFKERIGLRQGDVTWIV
jgi:hypothetical protein